MSRRSRHVGRLGAGGLLPALLAVLLLASGCGLPRSSTPILVPKEDVPYGLLDDPTASSSPAPSPGVALTTGAIYLADPQQRLVPVDVQVPQGPLVPLVQALLNRLAVGPSDRERARGLVTDLGPGSTIVLRTVINGTASIELQSPNQDPSPPKLPVAVAQIVLTAVGVVGVDRVVFVRDGTVVPVPGPVSGNLTPDPLVAGSYSDLLATGIPAPQRSTPLPSPSPAVTTTTISSYQHGRPLPIERLDRTDLLQALQREPPERDGQPVGREPVEQHGRDGGAAVDPDGDEAR